MTHDFWSTLCIPGGCPALFVPQWSEVEQPGFLLRWHWLSGGGYDSTLEQLTWGTEIVEAYHDTIDIISDLGLVPPRGLRLFPADRDGVERRHIRIGGGSLGLPFLLGALCFSKQVLWPSLTLAWGALAPVRDGTFGIFPVDRVERKIALAKRVGAKVILCPEGEASPVWGGNTVRVPRSCSAALRVLVQHLETER